MNNTNENKNDNCVANAKDNDTTKNINDTSDSVNNVLDDSSLEEVVGGFAPKNSFQSGVPLPRLDQF